MKKRIFSFAGLILTAVAVCTTTVFAEHPIQLFVNGKNVQPDVSPQMIEGRTMVPIRWVAEALGAEVRWDESSRIVTVETKNSGFENPYSYPRLPEEITSAEMLLQVYFGALANANHLTPEQLGAAGGTLGMGQKPYRTAYNYWSLEWRENHSYEQFLHSWSGTAHVELVKLIEAETQNGEARFFVETKHLEAVGKNHQFGEFYYTGFFSAKNTEEGWRLTEGSLEPQNVAWGLGGHQPWLADPIQVAMVHGLGKQMLEEERTMKPSVVYHTDDIVTVTVFNGEGNREASIDLVRPKEGIWKVVAVEKYIPFSSYAGPGEDIEEIAYSVDRLNAIQEAGKKYGIDPLIPIKGVATDYLMEIRLQKNTLEMVYPHFVVEQSNWEFVGKDEEEPVEIITSYNGQQMQWFPERRILYFKINDVYVAIRSAKSAGKEDFVNIASSFIPLAAWPLSSTPNKI